MWKGAPAYNAGFKVFLAQADVAGVESIIVKVTQSEGSCSGKWKINPGRIAGECQNA